MSRGRWQVGEMRMATGDRGRDPRPENPDDPSVQPEPTLRATVLPAGSARAATPPEIDLPRAAPPRRRLRWDLLLACVLALGALVVTVSAVRGLGGPAAPALAPAASAGSSVIVARSGASGLHVTERLMLPRPLPLVPLTRPVLSSPSLKLRQPVISDLRVTGGRVRQTASGWLVEPAKRGSLAGITIDYQVAGAVVPEPAAAVRGRALLVITPVSATVARELGVPVTVTAPGIDVRQAVCVTSPTTQQLCGLAGATGWSARLMSWQGEAVVVLQADLPA